MANAGQPQSPPHNDNEGHQGARTGGTQTPVGKEMYTYGPLFKIRYLVSHVGNLELPRSLTLTQFLAAIFGALFVFYASNLFVDGLYRVALAIVAVVFIPRAVSAAEGGGRSPILEVYRHVSFYFAPKLYVGARPIRRKRERSRLLAMVAEERALGRVRARTGAAGGVGRSSYDAEAGEAEQGASAIMGASLKGVAADTVARVRRGAGADV